MFVVINTMKPRDEQVGAGICFKPLVFKIETARDIIPSHFLFIVICEGSASLKKSSRLYGFLHFSALIIEPITIRSKNSKILFSVEYNYKC